jgi:SAM-dependent methyltransferase
VADGREVCAPPAPRFAPARIRDYYDSNTSAFVRYGDGRSVGAIHRAVWAPGVGSRDEALRYVEDRLADLLADLPASDGPCHLVDLGCGVGASLCYLASRLPIRGTGITLSPVQAADARQRVRAANLVERVTIVEGDFCLLPHDLPPADVVCAIEAFVHAPDAAAFLASCQRLLKPGATLVICDDFRGVRADSSSPAAEASVERFCRGWHVNSLLSIDELRAAADAAGLNLVHAKDLTPYLRLGRVRDRAIDTALVALDWAGWRSSRVDAWRGGSALQVCLANRWIEYQLVTLRRR